MKRRYISRLIISLTAVFMLLPHASKAVDLPENMMIIGYDGNSWFPYVTDDQGEWKKIDKIADPTQATLTQAGIAVKTGAQSVSIISDTNGVLPFLAFENDGLTQIRGFSGGVSLVRLLGGKSQETKAVLYDLDGQVIDSVNQASAQFHPVVGDNKIYYAHVSCRLSCSPLVQDVWVKTIGAQNARQLTKLNATTYLHSVDVGGRYGYISSNAFGYYHIATLGIETGEVSWLTTGAVTDSYPSISSAGDLFFLRRTAVSTRLMAIRSVSKGIREPEHIDIPQEIEKVRYLEIMN